MQGFQDRPVSCVAHSLLRKRTRAGGFVDTLHRGDVQMPLHHGTLGAFCTVGLS